MDVVILEGRELADFLNSMAGMAAPLGGPGVTSLRFAIDGGLKVKANSDSWTPPLGKLDNRASGFGAAMNLVDAVDDVVRAICKPGTHPDYHQAILTRHRREWPTLWGALDRLVAIR